MATASALVLAAFGAGASACAVEAGPAYPAAYDGDYPPDSFIATTEPVYFEGRASYWYGGRWYYRDGARWGHYDHEPAGLAQRRGQSAPSRYSYGRAGARATVHGGGRTGGHR